MFRKILLAAVVAVTASLGVSDKAEAITVGGLSASETPALSFTGLDITYIDGNLTVDPNTTASLPVTGATFTDASGVVTNLPNAGVASAFDDLRPTIQGGTGSIFAGDASSAVPAPLIFGLFEGSVGSFFFDGTNNVFATVIELFDVGSPFDGVYANNQAIAVFSGINTGAGNGQVDIVGAVAPVPLPAGMVLLLTAVGGLGIAGRKRRAAKPA